MMNDIRIYSSKFLPNYKKNNVYEKVSHFLYFNSKNRVITRLIVCMSDRLSKAFFLKTKEHGMFKLAKVIKAINRHIYRL